jgi:hypothetical protein
VRGRRDDEAEAHADILARKVVLDMTAYWQPTASYFGRVSKERIVQPCAKACPSRQRRTSRA